MKRSIGLVCLSIFLVLCFSRALSWSEADSPVQTIYRNGVPHTDRNGHLLASYDAESSFFPIGSWGCPRPEVRQGTDYDWQKLVDAGVNTVWPWPYDTAEQLADAERYGLQLMLMQKPGAERILEIKDHPNLLGIVWQDEPILQPGDQGEMFRKFVEYREMVNRVAPDIPVFVNNCSWISHPDWVKWNTAGDVSCHDNYPIWPVTRSLAFGSFGTTPNGIPQSMSLAVSSNGESKPVWLVVGAFESICNPTSQYPFRFPTPMQLRAMVYAGLTHGATGLCYFIWDSWVSRAGNNIGISRAPVENHSVTAKPVHRIASRALWEAMAQVNREVHELTPALLAPTIGAELDYVLGVEGEAITQYPIRAMLKPHPDRGYVLLTVNLDDAVLKASYCFEGTLLETVRPLFEEREPLKLDKEDAFADEYEPFDVHVYHVEFREQKMSKTD